MTGDAVSLRRAVPADAAAILAHVRAAYAIYIPRIGREPATMSADYAESIANHQVWIAEAADQLTGVLVLVAHDDHLLIENVSVDPAAQGQGIGQRLLRHTEEQARRQGKSEIRLYTNELFTENVALYLWYGYTETERAEMYGQTQVFMRKSV